MSTEMTDDDWMTSYGTGVVIEDAPAEALVQLHGWFRDRVEAQASARSGTRYQDAVRRMFAVLTFDSRASSSAAALRGATLDDVRHLAYVGRDRASSDTEDARVDAAGAIEVALSMYPAPDRRAGRVIVGQVLLADSDPGSIAVEVVDGDRAQAVTTTTATGEFTIEVTEPWSAIVLVGVDFELSVPIANVAAGESP